MNTCEPCGIKGWDFFTMPNGQVMCPFCSDAWVKLQESKTKRAITKEHGTIVTWSRRHGLKYHLVMAVLNKSRGYENPIIKDMPIGKLDVLQCLIADGYEEQIVADGLVDPKSKWR